MQTKIALSTIESEYIALSTAMCEVVPFYPVGEGDSKHAWITHLHTKCGKTMTAVLQLPKHPNSLLTRQPRVPEIRFRLVFLY